MTLPWKNIGKDTLPSSLINPASSPILDTSTTADATTTIDVQMEEGEIVTMAS